MAVNFGNNPGLSGSIPIVQQTTGPEYASAINTIITAILDRWQQAISPSDISIDDNLEMNGHAVTELSGTSYVDHPNGVSAGSDPRFIYFVDGEFYINDGNGNQVQMTDDGALNATAAGGIGGDYTATAAEVAWVASSASYFFKSSPSQTAQLDVKDIRFSRAIGEEGVTVEAPLGINSDYTLTLPTLPSASAFLQVTNSGSITASNTMSEPMIFTGNVTVSGSVLLDVFSGSILVDELAHGDRRLQLPPGKGACATAANFSISTSGVVTVTNGDALMVPIDLISGDRIKALKVTGKRSASEAVTVSLVKVSDTGTATTPISGTTPTATGDFAISPTGSSTVIDQFMNYVKVDSNGSSDLLVYSIQVTYDHPNS